ncbi:MAG TPA: hypothetical protein VF438_02015 [Candidatus Paceibacterota bacterium]
MTPEEHAKLDRALALAEENHALLLSLRRTHRIALGMRILYWVVIIGISFGAFYFVQPYLNFLTNLAGGDVSSSNTVQGTSSNGNLLKALHDAQESARGLQDLLK